MSDRWIDAEAVGLMEDDLYGYEDAALDEEEGYEDGDAYEAAEDEWEWAGGRGAFDAAYEDEWPESMGEYEMGLYEDSVLMAEGLREVLHEDYQDLSPEEMEQVLFGMLDSLPPEAEWSISGALKSIGKQSLSVLKNPTVSKVAGKVLPIAGGAVGTYFGGPAGTTIGASLGSKLASTLPAGRKAGKGARKKAKGSAKGGSAAAMQLLSLFQNDDVLKSALSLALGQNGRKSVKLGKSKPSVNLGPVFGLISNLSAQAAADADELAREDESSYRYLLDSEGEYAYDPADPGERDQALYEALVDAEGQRLMESQGGTYDLWEAEMSAEDWPPWWKRRQARQWERRREWAQQYPRRRDHRQGGYYA